MDLLAFKPFIAVMIPLVASILISMSSRWPNLREGWTFIAAFSLWGFVLSMLWDYLQGAPAGGSILALAPSLTLAFHADGFGLTFALVASTLWVATSFYAIGYARATNMGAQTRFFSMFAICLGSAIGIALAANLFTFLIFYEILTLATYPLVVHAGTPKARRAGRLYLCYALTGGALILGATAWCLFYSGTLEFQPGGFLPNTMSPMTLKILFTCFAIGFGVKAGVMPLHAWLPTAMIAPTPVSALLHAVAVVKAGVFGFLRLIYFVFGPELMQDLNLWQPLAWFAGTTILVSSLIAMRQDELKKRLAYSTIGHLSYIVLAAALLVPSAQIGALMHLANHAMMKITLFFCAGAIYVAAHKTRVSELTGLGWRMPWTFGAFAVGALGLAGTPIICGFVSKWWIIRGAMEHQQPVFMILLLVSGLLNAAYLLPVVTKAFDMKAPRPYLWHEAPLMMLLPLLFTAALSIAFGAILPLIEGQTSLAFNAIVQGIPL